MDRDRYGDALAVVTATPAPDGALERFLDTLATATTRPVSVVIAETAFADGAPAPARAAEDRPGVRVVRIGEDVGFAAAVNRAAAGLGAEVGWIAVAAPEAGWTQGALDVLLTTADRWPRAGALGPRLVDETGAGHRDGFGNVPAGGLRNALARSLLRRAAPAAPDVAGEGPVGWLSATCLLIRRQAFDSVDGFDPRYLRHLADVDLGDRLVRAGWRCVRVPEAVVVAPAPRPDPQELRRSAMRYLTDRSPGAWRMPLRVALGR